MNFRNVSIKSLVLIIKKKIMICSVKYATLIILNNELSDMQCKPPAFLL